MSELTLDSSKKERLHYIDLAKGVCITLVIVGHTGLSITIPGLDAIRMPLYFILSGLFFKDYGGLGRLFISVPVFLSYCICSVLHSGVSVTWVYDHRCQGYRRCVDSTTVFQWTYMVSAGIVLVQYHVLCHKLVGSQHVHSRSYCHCCGMSGSLLGI